MIAVDTNLLVYAHRSECEFHPQAANCIVSLAEGRGAWAIPWPCVHEFFAVVTNTKIFAPPTSVAVALRAIDAWLASPTLHLLSETAQHWPTMRSLFASASVSGARVHDARIAAICLEHGVREFWSADRDFRRFPALNVRNPLVL